MFDFMHAAPPRRESIIDFFPESCDFDLLFLGFYVDLDSIKISHTAMVLSGRLHLTYAVGI